MWNHVDFFLVIHLPRPSLFFHTFLKGLPLTSNSIRTYPNHKWDNNTVSPFWAIFTASSTALSIFFTTVTTWTNPFFSAVSFIPPCNFPNTTIWFSTSFECPDQLIKIIALIHPSCNQYDRLLNGFYSPNRCIRFCPLESQIIQPLQILQRISIRCSYSFKFLPKGFDDHFLWNSCPKSDLQSQPVHFQWCFQGFLNLLFCIDLI